jgi:Terpene synthase family 2, C-terminal metal binding
MSNARRVSLTMRPATEFGRVGAIAAGGQRDLARIAAEYPDLFPPRPFDPAMLGAIALASAYCAPWLKKSRMRMVSIASLWLFGLDLRAERIPPAAVDDLAGHCLAVADGGDPRPGDGITGLLALLRTELERGAPAFAARRPVWRDALRRTLSAIAREQGWTVRRNKGVLPSPDEYLDNAASTGFSVVFTTLWLTETASTGSTLGPDLSAAVRAAERLLRLVNDLGSYERELASDDLNVLMLGMTRSQLDTHIEESTHDFLALVRPVRRDRPRLATYVERQVGYAMGLYGIGDFWGER